MFEVEKGAFMEQFILGTDINGYCVFVWLVAICDLRFASKA